MKEKSDRVTWTVGRVETGIIKPGIVITFARNNLTIQVQQSSRQICIFSRVNSGFHEQFNLISFRDSLPKLTWAS